METELIRDEYNFSGLSRNKADRNPIRQFESWLGDALVSGEKEPTAMALATIGTDGTPQSRIVLLKSFNEEGFVFFTNYDSEKGKSLAKNHVAGLLFFWPNLGRQVRITGKAVKTNRKVSEEYFHSRPADSQISAWASPQSREISSRQYLEEQFAHFREKFEGKTPPLPDYWGGYRVIPEKIEFWQGQKYRLHDRILYVKANNNWNIIRLAP